MHTDNLDVKNTFEDEKALIPEEETEYTFENGEFKLYVKPLSWNVYTFSK